jgi:hypothetical protein
VTRTVAIEFPRDVRAVVMEPLLLTIHGLLASPGWFRPAERLAVELVGECSGVRLQVWSEHEPLQRQVHSALADAFVGGTVKPTADRLPVLDHFARLSLGSSRAPLRVGGEGAGLAAPAAPLGRLSDGQAGVIQFVLSAASLREQHRLLVAAHRSEVAPDYTAALRDKAAMPLFRVGVTVGASSATLRAALLAGFRQFAGPVSFPRPHQVWWVGAARRQLAERRHPFIPPPVMVGVGELAAVLGPEAAALRAIGGPVLGSRRLPPPKNVPTRGRVLAVSNAGDERAIALTTASARTHSAFIGPTNCGKTTQLVRQGLAAVEDGCGFVLIEPLKAGGTESFLQRLPAHFSERVVVLDPERERDFPPAINFLDAPGQDAGDVASGMLGVLRALHPDLGARTADVLFNTLYALASTPDGTVADAPRLLFDRTSRSRFLEYVTDPFVRGFFDEFDRRSEPDQMNVAAPAVGRLRPLLRPALAPLIGQARSTIDFDRLLAERRILLVRVPMGADLFGALIVDRLWRAALRRTRIPEEQRPDTLLAIDEAQAFLRTGADVPEMLGVARELRLALVLATQSINLCPPALRQAMLVNARTRLTWQTDESEARVLGRGLRPELEPVDLLGFGQYEVAIRLAVGGATVRPFTGRTLPLPPPLRRSTEEIRKRSRQRYGRPRREVEAELRERLAPVQSVIDPEAIGTRPR